MKVFLLTEWTEFFESTKSTSDPIPAMLLNVIQRSITTREEILSRLAGIRSTLFARYPIRELALFGSWARGEASPQSDIDLLVDIDPEVGLQLVDLAEELEASLGRRVDLVSSRAMKPQMAARIQPDLLYA